MTRILTRVYGFLLCLYPRQFRAEFGKEMQSVFAKAIADEPGHQSLLLLLNELIDLPGSLPEAYADQWFRGGNMVARGERILPSTRWQALIGTNGIKSKADLARYLGVSRARVTKVLKRLPL